MPATFTITHHGASTGVTGSCHQFTLPDGQAVLVAQQIVRLPYKHWHTAIAGAHGLRVKLQPAAPA